MDVAAELNLQDRQRSFLLKRKPDARGHRLTDNLDIDR